MKARVYIAGPYTKGDVAANVRRAYEAANELADRGFAPFVPHATHFWHMLFPRPYEFWLELDAEFLPLCDVVLRLPGGSNGADGEVEQARGLSIPVFDDIAGGAYVPKYGMYAAIRLVYGLQSLRAFWCWTGTSERIHAETRHVCATRVHF